MLLHLEADVCVSGTGREVVDMHAATLGWDEYRCPGCDTDFTCVSALFQHVESGSCEGLEQHSAVLDQLWNHIYEMIEMDT